MITSRNPVYAALWFALATLSTCGLFLLQSAPFLAAATIIVYAGAIIVTFLFVIMLAQQAGATVYDQRSRQPFCGDGRGVRAARRAALTRCKLWNVHRAMADAAEVAGRRHDEPVQPARRRSADRHDARPRPLAVRRLSVRGGTGGHAAA